MIAMTTRSSTRVKSRSDPLFIAQVDGSKHLLLKPALPPNFGHYRMRIIRFLPRSGFGVRRLAAALRARGLPRPEWSGASSRSPNWRHGRN